MCNRDLRSRAGCLLSGLPAVRRRLRGQGATLTTVRTRRESQGILVRGRNATTLTAVGIKRGREGERRERTSIERDGGSKNLMEGGNVPIRMVGEAARSRRRNTRRGRKRWREGMSGRRGKDELSSARGNPTWRKRKSSRESGTRRVREKEPDPSERRGKTTGLLKKFYLVGTLGLSDATERRCGVVGHGVVARPFRRQVANKESERKREREKAQVVCRDFRFWSVLPVISFRPFGPFAPSRTFARKEPPRTIEEALDEHYSSGRKEQPSLKESFFHPLVSPCIVTKVSHRCRLRERASEKDQKG